jgi:hypothetical protein
VQVRFDLHRDAAVDPCADVGRDAVDDAMAMHRCNIKAVCMSTSAWCWHTTLS